MPDARCSILTHENSPQANQTDPRVRNPDQPAPLTIRQAWERFHAHAEAYYRSSDGMPTREAANLEHAFRAVIELFASTHAKQFGPRMLKRVRDRMIEDDFCLNEINKRVCKIRHVFKWLASEELIPASAWHALQAIRAAPTRAIVRTSNLPGATGARRARVFRFNACSADY